jgi:hypothetical protein
MKSTSASARVRRAQAELIAAQDALERNARPWYLWWRKHRSHIAIGGGGFNLLVDSHHDSPEKTLLENGCAGSPVPSRIRLRTQPRS